MSMQFPGICRTGARAGCGFSRGGLPRRCAPTRNKLPLPQGEGEPLFPRGDLRSFIQGGSAAAGRRPTRDDRGWDFRSRWRCITRTQVTPERTWPDDALLLVAHGATRFADAGRWLHAHAEVLRAQRRFADVAVGLLNGSPSAAETLAALAPRVVHVVPFFMEQGWFVREAIPRALGEEHGHELRYHDPVGVHPDLADLAAARVQRACGTDAARFAVLLVGHGSARAPGRPMALHRHVEALSAARHFAQVRAAFLAEPPLVADALRDWRALPVAVVGWFAGEGGHVREDLPALLSAEQAARGDAGAPLLDLGAIADDPAMPRIILDSLSRDSGGG